MRDSPADHSLRLDQVYSPCQTEATPEGERVRAELGRRLSSSNALAWENPLHTHLGYRYDNSPICIADGPPPADPEDTRLYSQSSHPGGRAPHAWLERGGERLSTIDLLGGRFVLLTGPQGQGWVDAAARAASTARPELAAFCIGGGDIADPDDAWLKAYELEPGGAVLVRPDGYVAWRSRAGAEAPDQVLAAVFDRILGRV